MVGIGDMSGDVFGNGMLLSEHIRLVAAFDHRHIFLDPDPDAAASYRAAPAVRAAALIVGGLRRRTAVAGRWGLSAHRQGDSDLGSGTRRLGLADDIEALTLAELIRSILAAPVDLLWNGGIGTYIKATAENNADIGDKANDPIRLNGSQVRA